jgi:hypothetical protein
MGEEVNTSRRSFLKYLAIFLTIGAGVSIYLNSNKLSVEEAVKKALNKLKFKLEEVKPEAVKIVNDDIDSWVEYQLDQNIEKFLDWYYSIGGEIVVILYLATKYGNKALQTLKISSKKLKEYEDELNKKFADILFKGFLIGTPDKIKLAYENKINEFNREAITIFQRADINSLTTVKQVLDKISKKTLQHVAVAFSVSAIAGTIILRKVVSRFARKFVLKTGEKIVARLAVSKGTSLTGAVCGPLAPLCIAGLTALTEYVSIKVDEFFTRDNFREELKAMILADLNNLKPEIKDTIVKKVDETNQKIYEESKKIFIKDLLKS